MIKAVIFDYGGVIKKSHSCQNEIFLAFELKREEAIRFPKFLMDDFRKGKITEESFFEKLSLFFKKPIPQNSHNLWRNCYKKTFFIFPEMLEFIEKLKRKGIKTAILSNTIMPHLEIIKKHTEFKGFDVIIFSCEVGLAKPDPEIYRLIVKKLNVNPTECVFIDDLKKNLIPAKKIGMQTILAENPNQVIRDISTLLE